MGASWAAARGARPEVVIGGDTIRIGEDENTVVLNKPEWNVLVEAIQSASWDACDAREGAGYSDPAPFLPETHRQQINSETA